MRNNLAYRFPFAYSEAILKTSSARIASSHLPVECVRRECRRVEIEEKVAIVEHHRLTEIPAKKYSLQHAFVTGLA